MARVATGSTADISEPKAKDSIQLNLYTTSACNQIKMADSFIFLLNKTLSSWCNMTITVLQCTCTCIYLDYWIGLIISPSLQWLMNFIKWLVCSLSPSLSVSKNVCNKQWTCKPPIMKCLRLTQHSGVKCWVITCIVIFLYLILWPHLNI